MAKNALISYIGADKPGLISTLSNFLTEKGGAVGDTTFALLGAGAELNMIYELPKGLDAKDLGKEIKKMPEVSDGEPMVGVAQKFRPACLLGLAAQDGGFLGALSDALGEAAPGTDANASLSGRIVQFIALVTVLSIAPGLLVVMTSFTRFVIVLSMLRSALASGRELCGKLGRGRKGWLPLKPRVQSLTGSQ